MSTPNPQNVRRAGPDDLAALTESATMLIGEGALQEVSAAKIAALVARCVDRDRAIAGIIDGPDGIEASIGMTIESYAYSDAEHLSVAWLGVHPEHREHQPHGAKLMEFAAWAQAVMGVPLFMELSTLEELKAKLHLMIRQAPQVGARFSIGGVPSGAFSQMAPGDDPHGDAILARKRSRNFAKSLRQRRSHATAA